MSIRSTRNLYPGINPHLNSFLQDRDGGWESFHAEHLVDLTRALNQLLPPNYYASAEKSLQGLQIGAVEDHPLRARPDVTVYRQGEGFTGSSPALQGADPMLTVALAPTLYTDDYLTGVVIYELEAGKFPGRPVARVELLSAANKPGGSYHAAYMTKRTQTLRADMTLVELDYLHESPPLFAWLPDYRDGEPDATPYMILVSSPFPSVEAGQLNIYGFGVLDPIPVVPIPLSETVHIAVDFGAIYHSTYANAGFVRLVVDYAQPPERFSRYRLDDQAQISARMAEIAQANPASADD